jgi:hypothetical protein
MSDKKLREVADAALGTLHSADPRTRAELAVALSEAAEVVLDAVAQGEFDGTVEQFRLAAEPDQLSEAANWAELAAAEAPAARSAPPVSASEPSEIDKSAMLLLAAFFTPGAIGSAELGEIRELAREGDRLRMLAAETSQ